jgi:hypothetical protein
MKLHIFSATGLLLLHDLWQSIEVSNRLLQMNHEIWNKILEFDFDSPPSEYGFSIRLANENFWTKNFTEQAMLEYRKFMYLASTSDMMVSPSGIVDTVWHQHLIFTQSYQDFCILIGKKVQHIPSTHNKEDIEKFAQAKERTKKLYLDTFGEQPKNIWDYNDMYDSLNLKKAKFKIRTFLIAGILSFVSLIAPFYYLLRPVYVTIDNPDFIIGFSTIAIVTIIGFEKFNNRRLSKIVNDFEQSSFISDLLPLELVYLEKQQLSHVVNGTLNELIDNGTIQVYSDKSIQLVKNANSKSVEQLQATVVLSELGRTFYPSLVRQLTKKPIFWNTANCMDAFKKYFYKSRKFGNLFYLNFGVLATLLLLVITRLATGLLREKPVTQIAMVTLVLAIISVVYLNRLITLVCTKTVPDLYKKQILPNRQIEGNWQWTYFLFGSSVLTSSFIPVVNYVDKSSNNSSSCSTSCGSSCGSSCSSCGGCGGGD